MALVLNPAVSRIQPADIRNVLLTGHTGSGKTSLVERMLFENKSIPKPGTIGEATPSATTNPRRSTTGTPSNPP